MTILAEQAAQEVRSLHAAFVELFTGRSQDFDRCSRSLATDFQMITPDGLLVSRALVLDRLASTRMSPDFRISSSDLSLVADLGDSVLLRYIEEQYRDTKTTRRLATALFTVEKRAPCGVVWRHLQETWIPDAKDH
jgi:hypothetical protein